MRLIHAVREHNLEHGTSWRSVALTTDEERDATFAREADERYHLGPASRVGSDGARRLAYLDLDVLRTALVETRADAAWVGWGFVSESPEFAALCEELGVRLVGPSATTMRRLGDKIGAKRLAEAADVPVVRWSGGAVADAVAAAAHLDHIGLPVMVKAAAGGGGRGIRRVDAAAGLAEAFVSAQREALSAFGDGSLFLERAVDQARHVEVQVAADAHGTVWALGVRDCSVQRRRQKILEESGVPGASEELVERIKEAARRLLGATDYVGVATVEFLLHGEELAFMEVNTRLQVEHTVTEEVTGVDLVKLQLALALGEPLVGEPPASTGYAVEARVTAEDPTEGFRPAPGTVVHWRPALGPGLRMDTGIAEGDPMPPEYDPLLVKIVARGRDRGEAMARLRRGVEGTRLVIERGSTTLGFLASLLADDRLQTGGVTTDFVDDLVSSGADLVEDRSDVAIAYVAAVLAHLEWECRRGDLLATARRGRAEVPSTAPHDVELSYRDVPYTLRVRRASADVCEVVTDDGVVTVETVSRTGAERVVQVGTERVTLVLLATADLVQVTFGGTTYRVVHGDDGRVVAPLPAVVLELRAEVGQRVEAGDVVAVLESMKLEMPVVATQAGVVQDVLVLPHAQVAAGEGLLRITPDTAASGGGSDRAGHVDFRRLAAASREQVSVVDDLLRRLSGYDPSREDRLDRLADVGGTWSDQVTAVRRFGQCAALTGVGELTDDGHRPIRARDAFARVLADPERADETVPASYRADLAEALLDLGAAPQDLVDAGDALYRLARAGTVMAEVEPLVVAVLRHWLEDPAARLRLVDEVDAATIAQIAVRCEATSPVVSDLLWAAQRHLWLRTTESTERDVRPLDEATAERLELWRFAQYDVDHVSSRGDVHLLALTGRENAADRRLVAVAGVPSSDATVPGIEAVLFEAFAQIREHQASIALADRLMLNRVVLYVGGAWRVAPVDLQQATRRLAPAARNLGIERVIARVRVPREDGTLRDQVLHLTGPAETGLMLGVTEPSDEPLRPMTPRQQKLLRLRRRGLVDPYEIADLLVARHAEVSDFPSGWFRELDLDEQGRLVEVVRPPGENVSGIVVGVVTNVTRAHPDGMTRVVILGDPSRGLGALAEPECRRILAAIDEAARRGVPLEWFAVSSGAKVSMDSGTENLDWTARVLRRIIEHTQSGGEINLVLTGINVGAQSYFDAEATMLMHTKGILVMTPGSSMVLTGKDALDFAGGVSAEDNLGIGGHARIMGPNGQAQYRADSVAEACAILFRHYEHAYVAPGEIRPRALPTTDDRDRDVTTTPHPSMKGVDVATLGEVFSDVHNPGRNRPFDMRTLMRAVVDRDHEPLERWQHQEGAEGAIVWDARLDGLPVSVLGIESRPLPRTGPSPSDGPAFWSAATLFPGSSKKLARALNAASGTRPVVVLANLAGFDGSPESLRRLQLEHGAELGRAVVNFRGPIVFCVVSRYHGGAFVVFSKALHDDMEVLALAGSRASVIGGSAAASVVFGREVERRVAADPRLRGSDLTADAPGDVGRALREAEVERLRDQVRGEVRRGLADEFDSTHDVERALRVGSVDRIVEASHLRRELVEALERRVGSSWHAATTAG